MINVFPSVQGIFSQKATIYPLNEIITHTSFSWNSIILEFDKLPRTDLYLALISACAGFYFLIILLVLKNSNFPIWVTRKIVHAIGGTYIAFIISYFQYILGIILAIVFFLTIFLIMIFSSQFRLLKEYFILKDCRDNERDFTFLVNTSATLISLFILLIIFRDYAPVFTAGALIISWADTSGEVFGKKFPFGKYKIFNHKTISGTIAVFIFSLISFLVTILRFNMIISLSSIWIIIFGCLICSIVEAASWKWLDNIFLPVIGSLIMFWIVSINY